MKTAKIWALGMALAAATLGACGGERGTGSTTAGPATTHAAPTATVVATAAPTAQPIVSATATPTVAPAPAPSAAPKPAKSASGKLSVKRLVIAEGVKDREPIHVSSTFSSDEKIYAFVEVENLSHDTGEIVVAFEPPNGGPSHGNVTLEVGSSRRWRTWAFTRTARTAGSWTAVVKTKRGEVLAKTPFEVRG